MYSVLRYMMTLLPFGAYPNLCVSAEMLVTPGRRKSNGSSSSSTSSVPISTTTKT